MEHSLKGKTSLVTGLGRKDSIGMAIALALAERGSSIFFSYYYSDGVKIGMDEVTMVLRESGADVDGVEIDLSQPQAAEDLFSNAVKRFGTIDILVNNAACSEHDDIGSISADSIDRHYFVNVRTPMLLTSEMYERCSGKSGGRIINLTSGQALTPLPDELAYVTSKGALDTFTQNVAGTLMEKGVTINSVDPGATDTGWMTPEMKAEFARVSPLGRVGTPEDVARLVVFLVSEDAGYITGQVIHSRGGV